MPANLKINYIELPAADFDAQQKFYEAVFQWQFTDYGEQYRAFSDTVLDGGFYRSDKRSNSDEGAALVVFYADDIELTQAAICTHGGTIIQEIFDFPGGRRFHFADPHGNELAVWSNN